METKHRLGSLLPRFLGERALAGRVVAGDRPAFAELFRRYRQPLYGYCLSILGDQEDSADAVQDTMAKALKALPGEDRDLQLKPWLFRVARNECIDLIRSTKVSDEATAEDLISERGVEAEVAGRERLRELLEDLDLLPEKQRSALVMRELNGLSFEEIGNALGTTPSAAKQVIYEARVSLLNFSEGRSMECEPVREAISGRDGRVLRGRKVRAHIRACGSCRDFKAGIDVRSRDLKALVPAIPAAAAAAVIEMINGAGGGGAGLAGLAGVKAALGGSAMKATAVVAVAATVGAGTVGVVERNRHKSNEDPGSKSGTPAIDLPDSASILGGFGARSGSERSVRVASGQKVDRHVASGPRDGGSNHPPGEGGKDSGSGLDRDAPQHVEVPVPSTEASPGMSGGSGGSKGLGATPSHAGKPVRLPEAAASGQQRSAEAQSQSGPPVSPGKSAETPGTVNPTKKPAGSGKAAK